MQLFHWGDFLLYHTHGGYIRVMMMNLMTMMIEDGNDGHQYKSNSIIMPLEIMIAKMVEKGTKTNLTGRV